jgi:hypothetical protein
MSAAGVARSDVIEHRARPIIKSLMDAAQLAAGVAQAASVRQRSP